MTTTPAPLGIGLIGAGAMARVYAECLARHTSGGRLVAVTGGRRAGELAAAYGVSVEKSMENLLRRHDVSAVIIATPEMLHCHQTLQAAAAGRHVLVEKPMAPTVRECDEMIAACEAGRVRLMVVKHWRYRGVHARALELLRGGEFGRIQRIENCTLSPRSSSLATVKAKPFYLDPAGGGLLMGWAVHNLDWVRHLAGAEPREVVATVTPADAPLTEGGLEARITFADGPAAEVRIAIDLPEVLGRDQAFRTLIKTERGALDLDGYGHLKVNSGPGEVIRWTQPAFDPRNPVDPLRLGAFSTMLQGFIDSIRTGSEPPVTGRDGRMAVALYHAARDSARHGRPVAVG